MFTALLPDYLSDDEHAALQEHLCVHPDAGDLVKGSGGVRKVRWARQGSGKSGGVRVCYLRPHQGRPDFVVDDLCQERARHAQGENVLKALKEEFDHAND